MLRLRVRVRVRVRARGRVRVIWPSSPGLGLPDQALCCSTGEGGSSGGVTEPVTEPDGVTWLGVGVG